MANPNWRNQNATQTSRVRSFTITAASSGLSDDWTATVTLDDNTTFTVVYTEDGSPTTTEIAAGLHAAWQASTHPESKRITSTNPSAGVWTLTGTSGRPFTVALSAEVDGTFTETTTAGVSNSDYAQASNHSTDAVPVASDNVTIGGPGPNQQAASILYGLYQETVTIDAFKTLAEYTGQIGRIEDGKAFYLVVDPDSFDFRSTGQLNLINLTDAAIAGFIKSSAQPTQGRKAIYLLGSALTTWEIAKGSVGIAAFPNETATIATLLVSFDQNQGSDCDIELGSGLTLTTLTQSGGKVLQRCASTTTSVWDADLTIGTFVPYDTFAPTSTDSYLPQADHFAVTYSGNHYLYDSALDEISTGAVTATESIASSSAAFSIALDTTAACYRLLSNAGFGESWNSAYSGGYTPLGSYQARQIDADGNAYILEQSGTARRIRKLSGTDGTQAWSTAVATSAPHRQILYDPDEDIVLLLGTTSIGTGTDAVLAYDGATGTLVASHDMGDILGANKTSSYGAITGGHLYVACPTGNVP